MTDQFVIFKNNKTGKVEQIIGNDIETVNWQKFVGNCGIRIFLKNGALHRFAGFKENVSIAVILIASGILMVSKLISGPRKNSKIHFK